MLTDFTPPYRLMTGARPPTTIYDIDIIILALDRYDETMEAVRSALRQRGARIYVSVLDQGSMADNRQKFVAAFQGFSGFGYYTADLNLGVGGGRNLLSGIGRGRVIIALDNDAVFENETVAQRALAAFDGTPDLGALGFRICAEDGIQIDRLSWGYPLQLAEKSSETFETTTFVGAGHALRRTSWSQAGGYDASLFFTWEEYDLCLRMIAFNWRIRYDGSLCVIHKVAPEARVAWNAGRTRLFVRNRLLIARKWHDGRSALACRMGGYLVLGLLRRRMAPTILGITDALRSWAVPVQRQMSEPMRDYLFRNEHRYRGTLLQQMRDALRRAVMTDS